MRPKFGIELFGEPVIHWHFKSDSADKIYELFGKLVQPEASSHSLRRTLSSELASDKLY